MHKGESKAILAEEPNAADVISLVGPQKLKTIFWYTVSRLIQVVSLDRFNLHVSGIEKLPKSGPYIISSNHQSYIDPLILASILPREVFEHLRGLRSKSPGSPTRLPVAS